MKTLGFLAGAVTAAVSAAMATACSNDSGPVACGGCGCGDAAPQTQTLSVPFTPCDDAGEPDAEADAGDAGDAGDGGNVCFDSCTAACQASVPGSICAGTSEDGGATIAACQVTALCTGRKVEGLAAPSTGSSLGERLARMAWLEAVSVRAFERLARELRHHGAPASLVRRAERAARDEARHARIMTRLAKRHGAKVLPVLIARLAPRDLESVARENAVEACVGETFGAAQAALWATREGELGQAMRSIAPDELAHAALGWDVAAWAEAHLSAIARSRVRAARSAAARALLQDARNSPADRALASTMNASLWAA
ncbi:MAG TPA: ferritin-like domain-containing protein [Polyangiaceae bacterium]|jgi:hypothetical protein